MVGSPPSNPGDIVAGPFPRETLELVRSIPTAHSIRGNADRSGAVTPASDWRGEQLSDDEKAWLDALPFRLVLDDALYVHSTPRSDEEMMTSETPDERLAELMGGVDAAVVVCGHTHMPFDRMAGAVRVINPGSVGLPAYTDREPVAHAMEMGAPHARYAVLERRKSGEPWYVTFRVVSYDWDAASGRAAAKGREDWARWIKTGYAGG